jgi:hypothetical protein
MDSHAGETGDAIHLAELVFCLVKETLHGFSVGYTHVFCNDPAAFVAFEWIGELLQSVLLMSHIAKLAPLAKSSLVVAKPIPEAAPVTAYTFPEVEVNKRQGVSVEADNQGWEAIWSVI